VSQLYSLRDSPSRQRRSLSNPCLELREAPPMLSMHSSTVGHTAVSVRQASIQSSRVRAATCHPQPLSVLRPIADRPQPNRNHVVLTPRPQTCSTPFKRVAIGSVDHQGINGGSRQSSWATAISGTGVGVTHDQLGLHRYQHAWRAVVAHPGMAEAASLCALATVSGTARAALRRCGPALVGALTRHAEVTLLQLISPSEPPPQSEWTPPL
jgi:hypothetical protein